MNLIHTDEKRQFQDRLSLPFFSANIISFCQSSNILGSISQRNNCYLFKMPHLLFKHTMLHNISAPSKDQSKTQIFLLQRHIALWRATECFLILRYHHDGRQSACFHRIEYRDGRQSACSHRIEYRDGRQNACPHRIEHRDGRQNACPTG